MKRFLNYASGLAVAALLGLGSCVSTSTVDEPGTIKTESDEICLTLTSPQDRATRADGLHKLRYVAKLFKTNASNSLNFIQRKDLIEGENNNTLKFKVEPGSYSIMIFADYIPYNFTCDEDGIYPDYYYDTTEESERIYMLAFGDHPDAQNPINNDNYDCFNYYRGEDNKIYKEEGKAYTLNPVLKRAVAKVRFVSSSTPDPTDFKLTFSQFSYLDTFFQTDGASNMKTLNSSELSRIQFSSPSNAAENEIFYFYTMASNSSVSNRISACIFQTVTSNETVETNIAAKKVDIPIKRNYTTTVRGAFLYEEPVITDNPEDYIILEDMSTNQTWEELTPDITYDM